MSEESLSALEIEVLHFIKGTPLGVGLTSYPKAEDENNKKIHAACLELERKGLIHRKEHGSEAMLWMPKEINQ